MVREHIVPVTRLNKEHRAVIDLAEQAPVHLTSHGEEVAVMVSSDAWQQILAQLQELEDLRDVYAAYKAEIDIAEGREQLEPIDTAALQAELDHARVLA